MMLKAGKKMLNLSKLGKDESSFKYKGLGTQLFDDDGWKGFLYDTKQMIKNNKVLSVNVSMIEKIRNGENQKKKRKIKVRSLQFDTKFL